MPYQEVQFFAGDGVSLTGWYIPQSSHGRPSQRVIVCCHPYNHSKSNILGVARGFWEQRYSLFLFDFRSFARNVTPQSIGYLEQRDARAAIQTALQLAPTNSKIGIMGASMGGAVSLIVGHDEGPPVVGIATDCAFESLESVVEHAITTRYPMFPRNLTRAIAAVAAAINPYIFGYEYTEVVPREIVKSGPRSGEIPLLLMHAADDDVVPIKHAHNIYSAAKVTDKELVVVQHCHHIGCFFKDRPAYMRRVVQFFDRAFSMAEQGDVQVPSQPTMKHTEGD